MFQQAQVQDEKYGRQPRKDHMMMLIFSWTRMFCR